MQTLIAQCAMTILIGVSLAACSSPAPEVVDSSISSVEAGPTVGAGYVHTAAKSRFRLGASSAPISELGFSKIIGDQGVFATVIGTGWVMGIPNADAPSRSVSRLSWTADSHNKAVAAYFITAGLPADQVGVVMPNATVHSAGVAGENPKTFVPEGYTSRVSRTVAGFAVPDSFAWATFNDDGDVVEEGVFWPEIPASVVTDARALRDALTDPAAAAAFRSKLPVTVPDMGDIVIHHSPGNPGAPFQSVASYDILDRSGGMGVSRHFDSSGAEVRMIHELPPPPAIRPKSATH